MTVRIAVASTDGKYVNEHFGRAKQFLIFDVGAEDWRFVELRQNTPSCGFERAEETAPGHGHQGTVALLHDCRAVLVARIGPGAEQVLLSHGIRAYTIPDFIDEAIKKFSEASQP